MYEKKKSKKSKGKLLITNNYEMVLRLGMTNVLVLIVVVRRSKSGSEVREKGRNEWVGVGEGLGFTCSRLVPEAEGRRDDCKAMER